MTGVRLTLIILIFLGATVAWMILGGSIYARTTEAESNLRDEVSALWGDQLTQTTPTLSVVGVLTEREKRREMEAPEPVVLVPDSSEINVDLGLDLRRKGLHEATLKQWRTSVTGVLGRPQLKAKKSREHKEAEKRIRKLERELKRKNAALAETAALLVLKKKVQEIWGDGDDDTTGRNG